MRHISVALAWLMIFVSVPPGSAQVVQGLVMEDASEVGIATAAVVLLSEEGERKGEAVTDSLGAFWIAVPGKGRYTLRAGRIGFRTATSAAIEIDEDERLSVEFRLKTDAILLGPLTVVQRARPLLEGGKFYEVRERQEHIEKTGIGLFITREQIERQNPLRLTDVLRTAPGVRVMPHPKFIGRSVIRMTRNVGCPPAVFLDGMLLGKGDPADAILSDLSAWAIEGIEVYRGLSEIPAEFGVSEARCGIIAIWSKRGA